MAELKTQQNDGDVEAYLHSVEDERKRRDCFTLKEMMEEATGAPARMWGESIVGFGTYHYRYASGREGEWFLIGFAPRKRNLTLYIMSGFDAYDELLANLGKHSTGKSCLYVKTVDDVNVEVLRELFHRSVEHVASSNE